MKMLMAIINDDDAYRVMDALNSNGFQVTKLATTGGFLHVGNTTLISGVEDHKVPLAKELIEKNCKAKKQMKHVISAGIEPSAQYPVEVHVSGATIFVLDVEEFRKV